jgi:glucose/arabinose dehydrogenase
MTLHTAFASTRLHRMLIGVIALVLMMPATASAAVPPNFTETLVAGGLANPTAMAFAPDGRLFVAQQGGSLRVIKNGALLGPPFVTLTVNASGERGLLGVAFDPSFNTNGYVYLYYTATTPTLHNRVSRFTAPIDPKTGLPGDTAPLNSEVAILDLENLGATNHNGGAIHFGPDGKLYVAVGENAVRANSQALTNRLGKILRINANGTIPTDNPTAFGGIGGTTTGVNRAIWAVGLRNPYTFAFQPGTGRMFINDVGEGTWEEVNDGNAASNYGWSLYEGPANPPAPEFDDPISYYGHGIGCAITGGAFYNPPTVQFPADYVGDYFYADFCGNWIDKLDVATGTVVHSFATGISSPVDLQVASDGSLYYLARGSGSVWRINYTGTTQPPTIVTHPTSQTVAVGQPATFTVSASGTPPLSYQWQRNMVDIPTETSPSYTLRNAQLADSGAKFRVRVSNGGGNTFSNEATLTVTSVPPAAAFVKLIGTASLSKSGNTSITIPVPAGGVAAGHAVLLAATVGTFAGAVACRDSKGNVYSVDADIRGTGRVFVCSARNIVALVPGDTITATYPGFSGISAASASEFSGLSTVGPSATKSGNSAVPSVSLSATAGDVVFGAVTYGSTPTFTVGCGSPPPDERFTLMGEVSGGTGSGRKSLEPEYVVAPMPTSYNVCGTLTAPRPWLAAAVVYRP